MLRFPVIMGPTASGKSALALAFAEASGGEIVSVDSMQLYRGLDKGTAKPSAEERARVPHHLIDILEIGERSDLFSFVRRAETVIAEIRSRGKLPVAAGGTGLYLRGLLYGLDEMPSDPVLRKQLDEKYDSPSGAETLYAQMLRDAPDDARRWKQDRRKLIRAREVFLLSGSSITARQTAWKSRSARPDAVQFVLEWDREELRKRIRSRCREMLASGWFEETRQMLQKDLFQAPTAWQVLGYSAVAAFLRGELDRTELEEQICISTWQYARRQSTWFRTQHPGAVRLSMPSPEKALFSRIRNAL